MTKPLISLIAYPTDNHRTKWITYIFVSLMYFIVTLKLY